MDYLLTLILNKFSNNIFIFFRYFNLKQRRIFKNIKLTMVCHGEFEYIAGDLSERSQLQRYPKSKAWGFLSKQWPGSANGFLVNSWLLEMGKPGPVWKI